tara:strand:- start:5514 stop:6029 length:516 start_codon:yes stop_codon:yes gene_type:complete
MSIESTIGSIISNKVTDNNSSENLVEALSNLNNSVTNAAKISEIPFVFLRTNGERVSTTGTAGDLIVVGSSCPAGFMGTIEDFNVTFGTSGGTVELVILDSNNQVLNFLVKSITANQNGSGATVLQEGQRIGVRLNTSGSGLIGAFCSGKIKRTNTIVQSIGEAATERLSF